MNFEAFAKSVERAYPLAKERNPDCYSLDESMAVFSCYFEAYQQHIGQDHPPLKVRQIANIISTMDFSIDESSFFARESVSRTAFASLNSGVI